MSKQNSQQRRKQARLGLVDLTKVSFPWELNDAQCETMAAMRLRDNLMETGHPFHHLTASGAIVEPDPTLDYYLKRLPAKAQGIRDAWMSAVKPHAPQAIPVNRLYYGHDLYKGR